MRTHIFLNCILLLHSVFWGLFSCTNSSRVSVFQKRLTRMDAAVDAMLPLGFSEAMVKNRVKKLLKVELELNWTVLVVISPFLSDFEVLVSSDLVFVVVLFEASLHIS